jgi:hypothetical protein
MSIDFKIQNVCDHVINWETARLSTADYKSVEVVRIIASGKSVKVRVNGTELDPSGFQVLNRNNLLDPKIVEKYIYLSKKERSYRPLIEVQYTTDRVLCPKCLGGTVLDDIKYGAGGDFATVEKEQQLIQTLEKYIITRVNSNKFHTWMGTDIHGLLGSKIFDFDTIRLEVVNQINIAVNKLKEIQAQLISSGREVSGGEIFEELISIEVVPNESDPTIVSAVVTFTSRSGNTLQFEQLLEFGQLRERVAY